MKRVALLGCGAIGTSIAKAIDSGVIPAHLHAIYDTSRKAAETLAASLECSPEIAGNSHLLSYPPVDIVVEAASQQAVRDVGLSVIQNRRDLMVMSAGALLDDTIGDVLRDAADHYGSSIYLPSGAVAGIDAIVAVRDSIRTVTITTTKHPRSLPGHIQDSITEPVRLFSGGAKEAVRLFPANVNVAALVSLAAGREARVVVIADPHISTNRHAITLSGDFGSMEFILENRPDPTNPKTSRLATLAAIETLRRYCAGGIRIGT